MSNEVTTTTENEVNIITENGMSIEEMMGIKTQSEGPSLARLSQIQSPIKGERVLDGETLQVDVHKVGAFALRLSDDQMVYAKDVTVRIFLQREQWTHWDSETKTMNKSVLANDVKNDMQDTLGGFNLGRPSGYIEHWDALPEDMKNLIRSVKRTRVVMGLVTLKEAKDAAGKVVKGDFVDVPFIYDIKNNNSFKTLDAAFKSLARKNVLPLAGVITLEAQTDKLASGNVFAFIKASVTGSVPLSQEDSDTLKNFYDVVKYTNASIMDKYHENKDKTMDAEDAAIVGSIVDVEE
jgi:hypothetical protein